MLIVEYGIRSETYYICLINYHGWEICKKRNIGSEDVQNNLRLISLVKTVNILEFQRFENYQERKGLWN
jgi:hypothetical protein